MYYIYLMSKMNKENNNNVLFKVNFKVKIIPKTKM